MQEKLKAKIEKELATTLNPIYSSRDDNNEDEEFGHYVVYEALPNPLASIEDRVEPASIKVYDQDAVQLYHDATPYPVKANSEKQAKMMGLALTEAPVPSFSLTKQDWQNLINKLLSEYGDDL